MSKLRRGVQGTAVACMLARRPRVIALAMVLPLAALGACKKEGKPGEKTPAAAAANDGLPAPLREAFGKASLEVGPFATADGKAYAASRCARGRVSKLEVLFCEYPSEEAAKAAQQKLATVVGAAVTGAVRQHGKQAVVVVDRDKVDLQGKTINKLLGAFFLASATAAKPAG